MPLTKAWYTQLKAQNKVGGKSAPETPWEKALDDFEEKKGKLERQPTVALCDAALSALKTMKDEAKGSGDALEAKQFAAVAKEVYSSGDMIKKEKVMIEKIRTDLLLVQLREKAANNEEAVYETLWHEFEQQREAATTKPSLAVFKLCKASLDKLVSQAEACGHSSPHLLGKYNKQAKVLAGIQRDIDARKVDYKAALAKAVTDRQGLLADMQQLTGEQDAALVKLKKIRALADAAVTARNSFELIKLNKAAKVIADEAITKQAASAATFAPGTVIRDAQDLKDAKIHADESSVAIRPISDKIFTENKGLIALDKQIKQLMTEIAGLKVGKQ